MKVGAQTRFIGKIDHHPDPFGLWLLGLPGSRLPTLFDQHRILLRGTV